MGGGQVTVSASNYYSGNLMPYMAVLPIEDIPIQNYTGLPNKCWHTYSGFPQWFMVDFGHERFIGTISFYPISPEAAGIGYCGIKDYEIQKSDDGNLFETVISKTYIPKNTVRHPQVCNEEVCKVNINARYVRIYVKSAYGSYVGLTCFTAYNDIVCVYVARNKNAYISK